MSSATTVGGEGEEYVGRGGAHIWCVRAARRRDIATSAGAKVSVKKPPHQQPRILVQPLASLSLSLCSLSHLNGNSARLLDVKHADETVVAASDERVWRLEIVAQRDEWRRSGKLLQRAIGVRHIPHVRRCRQVPTNDALVLKSEDRVRDGNAAALGVPIDIGCRPLDG